MLAPSVLAVHPFSNLAPSHHPRRGRRRHSLTIQPRLCRGQYTASIHVEWATLQPTVGPEAFRFMMHGVLCYTITDKNGWERG